MKINNKIVALFVGVSMMFSLVILSVAQDENRKTDSKQQMPKVQQNAEEAMENLQPQEVTITATDYKFAPDTITVPAGRKVKVTLVNNGKRSHNIEFDFKGTKVKIPNDLAANTTGSVEFTAPDAGTYDFICPVGMHATIGMKGKLIVTEQ